MEKFRMNNSKGVWSEHGEYAKDAVVDSAEGTRADELLDGQDWNVVTPTLDHPRNDPTELSFIKNSVADTLIGEIDGVALEKMTFDNGRSYNQGPVDPMGPTPDQIDTANRILNNKTFSYDTTPSAPFPNNDTYNRVGKNSLNPTTPRAGASEKTKSFFQKLFGG